MKQESTFSEYDFEFLFDPKYQPRSFWGNEARLRQLCALSVKQFPNVEPLRSFALVGATTVDLDISPEQVKELRYGRGFSDKIGYEEVARDTNRLRNTICYLIRSGLPVAPNFSVSVYNLLENKDYLADTSQSDVVMMCYLVNRGGKELQEAADWQREYNNSKQYALHDPSSSDQEALRQQYCLELKNKNYPAAILAAWKLGGLCSPLASPEAWGERLRAAEPKLIFNFHAEDSLPIHIKGNSLRTVVDDKTGYSEPHDWDRHRTFASCVAAELEQKESTPFRAEIVIDSPYMDKVQEHLTDETLLTQAIRHAVTGTPVTNFKGYSHGYFGDGDSFIPVAPYRKPIEFRHDFLRFFWSLANPNDQSFDAQYVRATIGDAERVFIERRIENFLGAQSSRPAMFRSRFTEVENRL